VSIKRKRRLKRMAMVQMAMEVGMGTLLGALMADEYRKVGVQNTKGPSIAIIQKGSLSEHIVKEKRK